jgi:glycosyltransferase involved in cell wall biosynthesis
MENKKPKIKITYILPTLDQGGAERFFVDLIKNLDLALFAPRLILYKRGGEWQKELEKLGIPLVILKKRFKFDLGNFRVLVKSLAEDKPDIVHTQLGGDIYGVLAAKIVGVKTIISTEVNTNLNEGGIYNLIKKFVSRLTTKVIAVSLAVKTDYLKRYGASPDKVVVIYNGIETKKFLAAAVKSSVGASLENNCRQEKKPPFIFGTIGRLEKQKGQKFLIAAFADFKNYNAKLLIAGQGSLDKKLQAQIKANGLQEKVELVGAVQASEFLHSINAFVLPSLWEGMGIVLVEAALAGKPIIASAVGGISEVLSDDTAWLVKSGDEHDLAVKMLEVFKNIDSPLIRSRVEKLKEDVSRRFDILKITKEHEELYRSFK